MLIGLGENRSHHGGCCLSEVLNTQHLPAQKFLYLGSPFSRDRDGGNALPHRLQAEKIQSQRALFMLLGTAYHDLAHRAHADETDGRGLNEQKPGMSPVSAQNSGCRIALRK